MQIITDGNANDWDSFIGTQPYAPFLQSSAMQSTYKRTNQNSIRFTVEEQNTILAGCMAVIVPAKRGPHLSVPYGPIMQHSNTAEINIACMQLLITALTDYCKKNGYWFVRLSPHWPEGKQALLPAESIQTPLHLLAEHLWYIPLRQDCRWSPQSEPITKDTILMSMRKTTRNLVRRAERDGVTIQSSSGLGADFNEFIRLHDETRKRHHFTPYTNEFFKAEVEAFSARNECTVYTAWYEGECICASIHIHSNGETSYHHGASSSAHLKIPASYLLQWHAICDAVDRGDHVYNFWGIAPVTQQEDGKWRLEEENKGHPFAGVTTFKTGFGGTLLELIPCHDIPVRKKYYLTRWFEQFRKWKRGF